MCLKIAEEREQKLYPFLVNLIENECSDTENGCIDSLEIDNLCFRYHR